MGLGRGALAAAVAAMCGVVAAPAAGQGFDPMYEATNFGKTNERFEQIVSKPEFQQLLREKGLQREREALEILAADGPDKPAGRDFTGNLCWQHMDGCAGDVRLYDWVASGAGIASPILFTARNGATLSGRVWATKAGPPKRPAVLITNGSVQAPEELYWSAATVLAKAGFVVMTFDPQGQGYSDTYGEGVDRNEGVPSQAGRPFFDGTEDALDFLLSTPAAAYRPRPSCTTGTDHSPKHRDRVARGLSSAFNPFWELVDPSRIGMLGQSLGAGAVSYLGQVDPRVSAIVAMDNLQTPTVRSDCPSAPQTRPAVEVPTKPALGLTNDYALFEGPKTSQPDPQAKGAGSRFLTQNGVDTGSLVERGGTHFELAFIPNPAFPATFRGNDLYAWYLTAWFDRYVKGDRRATARLLTDRWRADAPTAAIDPDGDGNHLSRYYASRLVLGTGTADEVRCEALRDGCPALAPDGQAPVPYNFLDAALAKDEAGSSPVAPEVVSQSPAGATGVPPAGRLQDGKPVRAACADRRPPRSTILGIRVLRRGLVVRGRSSDASCARTRRAPARVLVAVARRVAGGRCRALRPDGRLAGPRSCTLRAGLPARGRGTWSLTVRRPLPAGRYLVTVSAVDAAGNVERRGARTFRVR